MASALLCSLRWPVPIAVCLLLCHLGLAASPGCTRPDYAATVNVSGGSSSATEWASTCQATVAADFAERDKVLASWDVQHLCYSSSWGPYSLKFAATPKAPSTCYLNKWVQQRILAAVGVWTRKGYNYCHHHIPSWLPPAKYQTLCNVTDGTDGSASTCACSAAGFSSSNPRPNPNMGVDCSNYVAWLYNYAFGAQITSGIGSLACGPASAPGAILPYTSSPSASNGASNFLPGDLLFIRGSSSSSRISHVIIWTGYTVDFTNKTSPLYVDTLLKDVGKSQLSGVQKDIAEAVKAGRPVYVTTDSTNNGPSLRPFAGWYVSAFSHARRLLLPDASLPTSASYLQYKNGDCLLTKKRL